MSTLTALARFVATLLTAAVALGLLYGSPGLLPASSDAGPPIEIPESPQPTPDASAATRATAPAMDAGILSERDIQLVAIAQLEAAAAKLGPFSATDADSAQRLAEIESAIARLSDRSGTAGLPPDPLAATPPALDAQ